MTQMTPAEGLNLRHAPGIAAVPRQADPTLDLVGHRFVLVAPSAAAHAVLRWTAGGGRERRERRGRHIHLVNAYTLALAHRDRALAGALRGGVNLIDGTPLAWLAAASGAGEETRRACRGPQLFHDVLEAGSPAGTRHYLLGGSPETLAALQARIAADHPDAVIAGACSPPFRPLSDAEKAEIHQDIRRSRADIVWIGLGTPKQDFVARDIAEALGVTTVAIGAAFDFASGLKPEAPRWLQGSGLEWAYRLATEPRRLWKRYLFGNARFLQLAVRHLASGQTRHARLAGIATR